MADAIFEVPRSPADIPARELPGRFVCLIWHETATEFLDGHVEVFRSIETHQITAGNLGTLFETIREHAKEIAP